MMLHDLARNQAERFPDSIAVTYNNRHMPYSQLESESNRLAVLLRCSGVEAGDRIGLLMEKSPEMIVAVHGISKVGGISVPLDSIRSASKLDRLSRLSGISLMMTDDTRLHLLKTWNNTSERKEKIPWSWWSTDALPESELCHPRFTMTDIDNQADLPLDPPPSRESDIMPAQLLFQPNRFGFPSPLAVTHREIVSFAEWCKGYFGIRREDRVAGWSPLSMGLSILDLYGTFTAGAHLYIPPTHQYPDGDELSGFILENDITQWSSPPAVFHALASENAIGHVGYPGLERLIWWGDQILEPVLHYWMQHLPKAGLTRLFSTDNRGLATRYHTIHGLPQKMRSSDIVRSRRREIEMDSTWMSYHDDYLSPQSPIPEYTPGAEYIQDALSPGTHSRAGNKGESAHAAGVGECLAVGPDGSIRHQQIIRSGQRKFLFEQGQIVSP